MTQRNSRCADRNGDCRTGATLYHARHTTQDRVPGPRRMRIRLPSRIPLWFV